MVLFFIHTCLLMWPRPNSLFKLLSAFTSEALRVCWGSGLGPAVHGSPHRRKNPNGDAQFVDVEAV